MTLNVLQERRLMLKIILLSMLSYKTIQRGKELIEINLANEGREAQPVILSASLSSELR